VLLGWAAFLLLLVLLLWVVRGERGDEHAEEHGAGDRRTGGDRRSGLPDRRRGLPDPRPTREERRAGPRDRRSGRDRRSALARWGEPAPATGF
jgi:hypothetical protein